MYGEEMSSLAQRLEMTLTNSPQRIDQKRLAEMIGKKKNWITDVKAGRRPPGEAMKKAAQILGVPEEWLLHGTGPAVLRGVQTFGVDLDLVKLCLAS